MGNYQVDMVENTNKKYSRHKGWNYFYSYLGVRNTIDARKFKAITRMNEHEDMHTECDTVFFVLRSLTDQWEITK